MAMKMALAVAAVVLAAGPVAAQQGAQPSDAEQQYQGAEPLGRRAPGARQTGQPEAWQQQQWPSQTGAGTWTPGSCPLFEMGRMRGKGQAMQNRMRQAGVPEETIKRARMLMQTRIHPADPQALLTLRTELNLSDQQVGELRKIIQSAQEQALGVLSAEQWDEVRRLSPRAESPMQLHQAVMPYMRAQMQQQQTEGYGRPGPGAQQAPTQRECPMVQK